MQYQCMSLNPVSYETKIELNVAVCVCMCTSYLPRGTYDQEPYMNFQVKLGLDTVFKHVSAQSNKRIAGGMAEQQQTLKISVNTPSKGYWRKEGESGHYLKTCQYTSY